MNVRIHDADCIHRAQPHDGGCFTPACGSPYDNADLTGIVCQLAEGHPEDHFAQAPLTWPRGEDEQP